VESARSDREAFSELARRHRPVCLQVANSILRDRANAEDAVQDSLLKAFVHFPSFECRANFRTWLCRIVINDCKMFMRSARRAVHLSVNQASSASPPVELSSNCLNPEENLQRQEIAAFIYSNAHQLPVLYRNVVTLSDLKGLNLITVAECLGITPAAAKTRLIRARRLLRDRLEPHFCSKLQGNIYGQLRSGVRRTGNLHGPLQQTNALLNAD
jgi:RNA polymerase sigma-70 factor, ECF subfamily